MAGGTVMTVVSDTASITQLISNATASFSAIQKALKDINDLPPELKALKHIAQEGDMKMVALSKLVAEDRAVENRVRPSLERLSKAVVVAGELDRRLAGKRSAGKDFVEGLLGRGANEQLSEAKRLKKSIQEDLRILDGAILEVIWLRDAAGAVTVSSRSLVPDSEIAIKLERLSNRALDVEKIITQVRAAASHSSDYQVLASTSKGGDVDDEELERGSVIGGLEVENNSKIRLTMEADDARYFYIVTLDSSNWDPQLYYPTIAGAKNQLQRNASASQSACNCKRIFPDSHRYKDDDPELWRLTKDPNLQANDVERCFAYVVFSRSRLESDGQVPTIMHVELKLNASWADEEIIVERLQFDLK